MEKYITKTLGHGEEIIILNPDLYNDEGDYQKHRRVLNWQPKKKKRKKHKKK